MEIADYSLGFLVDAPDDPGVATFLWYLYQKGIVDVFFELKTENDVVMLSAHRLVLSMWSPYFADMLYGSEKKDNKISLTDVNPQAFEDMLKFMYGCDPIFETCSQACELHKVAVKFQVTSLINLCHQFLNNVDIQVANVFNLLETSKYMQNRSLTDRCLRLIQNDTKNIIEHYELTDISPSMIGIILDSTSLSLDSEFELLQWIFAWAKNWYIENEQYSNSREVLIEFLPRLHFLALTDIQFAMLNKRQKDFFSEAEVAQILMNIAIRDSWPMPDWYDTKAKFREYTGNK